MPTNSTNPLQIYKAIPLTKGGWPDRRFTRHETNTVNPASGATKASGYMGLAVNILNSAYETRINYVMKEDVKEIKKQASQFLPLVARDINIALQRGLIPLRYQNSRDLSNIGNVILQGESNSMDPGIKKVGYKIYSEVSVPERSKKSSIGFSSSPFRGR